jgi:hypothetical protein
MKRFMKQLTVLAMGIVLIANVSMAQHDEHHSDQKAVSNDTTKDNQAMMSMDKEMMSGENIKRRGMMEDSQDQSEDMIKTADTTMMHGDKMMQGCMHGTSMMKGMQDNTMRHDGMIGMGDDVIHALYNFGYPGILLKSEDELKLTASQKEKLEVLQAESRKFAAQNSAHVDMAKIELSELLNTSSPDFAGVKTQLEKISTTDEELKFSLLNTIFQARDILTSEQLAQVKHISGDCCSVGTTMGMTH